MKKFLALTALTLTIAQSAFAANIPIPKDKVVDIWSKIPFFRGADICRYNDAYSQTRTQYMNRMVGQASELMAMGAKASEAMRMLQAFNDMYDRNLQIATLGLDTTLESTMLAFVDEYYRDLNPNQKKLQFINMDDLSGFAAPASYAKLDYMAYGTYSFAPSCKGDILVTLHLVGKNRSVTSYKAQGKPEWVMSKIASDLFTDIQRTKFPTDVTVSPGQTFRIIGGPNGHVGKAKTSRQAEIGCRTMGGRLPTFEEIEVADAHGDWNGGVSLNDKMWWIQDNKIYAPMLQNPSPVREPWEVNPDDHLYFCVK